MCAGAILNARIPTVVFGASDPRAGACGSAGHLLNGRFDFTAEVYGGIMEAECEALLREFFDAVRARDGETEK